jgi:type IV pilus assembly protein PilE
MKSRLPKASGGFTLIELMIVLLILAVLSAVALPAYQDSGRKTGRAAAKGALMDVAMRQEQFFINNKSYAGTLTALGLPDPYYIDKKTDQVAATDGARIYQLTLANTTAIAYDAVATAVLDQAADSCGNYTLKHDGTRAVSGGAGSATCW